MDQLKGNVVSVVLTIQEGKGMDPSKGSIVISANFNGRILDSDPVPSVESPPFNTNLIWEVDKKSLRKIRSSNMPLRVECISVDGQRREKLGHVLLDLRSAQIIVDETQQIPYKWLKLIGTKKKRSLAPEVYLSLTIRNHYDEADVDSSMIEEDFLPPPPPEISHMSNFPIKYLEDGYIKIGDENCTEDFSLNVLIKSASNLDMLLPEVLVFHQNKNKYCMSVRLFNVPITTKQFSKELHDTINFDEKIVVQLLSNIDILKEFFSEESFEVGFYCGTDLLGITKVPFEGLKNPKEKLVLSNCYFRFPSANGIIPMAGDGRKPSISLEIYFVRLKKKEMASGDGFKEEELQQEKINLEKWKEEQRQAFEKWKVEERHKFEEELLAWSEVERQRVDDELDAARAECKDELDAKKAELDENIAKCKELQTELQLKLEELRTDKALKKNRMSLGTLMEENHQKFGECEKELLIDYISKLQKDVEDLKKVVAQQKVELDSIQRTALSKEQTASLLQELKGLEEKFEVAQQTKTYFKEQWKRACEEIHELKSEDYKLLQDHLRERKEELDQFSNLLELELDPKQKIVTY